MRSRRWVPALLAAAIALGGCELALIGAAGGAAFKAIEDRRTAGAQIEDETIELRATNRIYDRFDDKVHINITSYNRSVLLTGEVPDTATREEVERIVFTVANVRGVANELEIAGVSSLTARTNDSLLTSKVKLRFLDADRFNPLHVKVVSEAGVVYLMGLVTRTEADHAVEIARTTGGVRKVVKMFEYCTMRDGFCRL